MCYISTIPTDTIADTITSRSPVITLLSCNQCVAHRMPISDGHVNKVSQTVLWDIRCSRIVVRRSKIKKETLIDGENHTSVPADGSRIKVPVAEVFIATSFHKRQYEVWCMDNPVYDLIVGNISDAKPANQQDPK